MTLDELLIRLELLRDSIYRTMPDGSTEFLALNQIQFEGELSEAFPRIVEALRAGQALRVHIESTIKGFITYSPLSNAMAAWDAATREDI